MKPDAPSSLGGASLHALASILDLYDPEVSVRYEGPRQLVDLGVIV